MVRIPLVLLLLLAIYSGCAVAEKQRSPKAIIASFKLFNRDSRVDAWRERMESEGFECEMVENGTFMGRLQKIGGADFLLCRRETAEGTDEVALIVEANKVVDTMTN